MAVDPSASLISHESLQAAELISNVAYGQRHRWAGRDRKQN
jgi:hypothetical protein